MIRSFAFVVSLLAAAPALAQEAPDVVDLLSHTAPVTADGWGYRALPLSDAVLSIARADLSDVRLVAEDGSLVPYAVVWRTSPVVDEPNGSRTTLTLASARQTIVVERGARSALETYQVDVPPLAWRVDGALDLVTTDPEFTATVRVTSADGSELAGGTIFALPAIHASRSTIPLPSSVSGRVTIEVRREPTTGGPGAFLTPQFVLHERAAPPVRRVVERTLEVVSDAVADGSQRVEVVRPSGLVPFELRIETTSTTFASGVRVEAIALDGARERIGDGHILRITPREPFGTVSEITVGVHAPAAAGERLVVSIERGDSPPLEAVRIVAVAAQPLLVFDGSPETLAFGGGRLEAPDYDIARLGLDVASTAGEATLGEVVSNPSYHPEPALAFAMRAGAAVDRARFPLRVAITVGESPEGLVRLRLTPEIVGRARTDQGDLRIVDAEGRQWPYVISPTERDVWTDLTVAAPTAAESRDRTSVYRLTPAFPVGATAIDLDIADAFFSRSVEVVGRLRPDLADDPGTLLVTSTLGPGATAPELSMSASRVRGYELFVEDGDEAPLAITGARARVPVRDLLAALPAGEYVVLVGDESLAPPAYDLGRASPALFSNLPALEIDVGALGPSPEHRPPSLFERGGWEAAALYVVLGLAVLVLGFLTFRLARAEAAAPPAAPTPAAPTAATDGEEEPAGGDEEE